ncbi:prostasin-like isoform X1 [Haliotis rufescens]|uniref:prostasin-like isoform X1 n=1 Tax=Haliotis rufescens TaxID=6454 RepID=UPI00201F0E97|nr:prostasin-like isoform X1 [Haliotis rufescens]
MAALLLYIAAILFSVGVIGRQLADECRQHGGICSSHHSDCHHIFRSADCHHQHGHTHLCCVGQHPLTHPTIDVATAFRTQSIQYSNPTQCGTRVLGGHIIGRRIVGGSRSVPGEWPWQAFITYNDKYACSGAIIANTWLLTAAHCMQHADNAGGYMVRAGEYNTKAHDGTEQYYSIHSILLHPEFNKITGQNDIALIRINSQFAFNNNVRPICLPKTANSATDCVVSGWGETHVYKPSCLRALYI